MNKIILDSKKLNIIQRFLFNRSEGTIDLLIGTLVGLTMFVAAAMMVFSPILKMISLFFIGLTIFIAVGFLLEYIESKIVISATSIYRYEKNEIREKLNNVWFINKTAVKELLEKPWTMKKEDKKEYLKSSFGHEVIKQSKLKELYEDNSMISYIESPGIELVKEFMDNKYKKDKGYMFKDFNFEKIKDIDDLRSFYIKAKNFKINNDFQKRSIEVKSKEELVKYLNKKLVC